MTARETTQLTEARKDIEYMKSDIEDMKKDIKEILKKLDQDRNTHSTYVTKKAMQWIVGTAIAITSVAISIINSIKAH